MKLYIKLDDVTKLEPMKFSSLQGYTTPLEICYWIFNNYYVKCCTVALVEIAMNMKSLIAPNKTKIISVPNNRKLILKKLVRK